MPQSLSYHPNPFGSVMQGRNWTDANRKYRYGFNGKEKDFETANDNYDFGARIYDGRLGRWLSLDPMHDNYPYSSAYVGLGNCPISILDPDGKKVENGWCRMMKEQVVAVNALHIRYQFFLNSYEKLGVNCSSRKGFIGSVMEKKGISRKEAKIEWNILCELRSEIVVASELLNYYREMAIVTDINIMEWCKTSRQVFLEISELENAQGEEITVYILSESLEGLNLLNQSADENAQTYGLTSNSYVCHNNEIKPASNSFGLNSIIIYIPENWNTNKCTPDGENIFNHEAGHAIYYGENAEKYYEYSKNLEDMGIDSQGGHRSDDESGKKAEEYGKIDSCKI